MRRMTAIVIAVLAGNLSLVTSSASAQQDKYHITQAEWSACMPDAIRLCSDAYPNEDRLLTCMKQRRVQLSNGCAVVFKAGLSRRHL